MHLNAQSWYSFHCGVSNPRELCEHAAELGFAALGLCDTDGIYGLIAHYQAAQQCGIRAVLGVSLSDPKVVSRRSWEGDPTQSAAVLLARNRDGYSELCWLATERQLNADFDIRRALLEIENCFVLTDRQDLLDALYRRFGPRRLFVRATPLYATNLHDVQTKQARLAERYGLKLAACTDVTFVRPQDHAVHVTLRAIGQNTILQRARGTRSRYHYLAAPTELLGYYFDYPDALSTAQHIAEQCEVIFEENKWHFPEYNLGGKQSAEQALCALCEGRLNSKLGQGLTEQHKARLEMELNVIAKLGFAGYFLFVYDIVGEAAKRGIFTLGRGSAANSLVSYLLSLTPIDPLKYNLVFERFLNPERSSPPDIDIDFSWKRRDEMLQFVYDRWGAQRVALISTHITYRGKSALREVAKTFGLGDEEISEISDRLPGFDGEQLANNLQRLPELKGINLNVEPYRHILPLAARLQRKPRHLGIHCGGIVIAPQRLTDFTALQRAQKGFITTQYEMRAIEKIGLIKIDLLGNRSLGVLEDTLAALAERSIRPPVDKLAMLTQDARTVELIATGRTQACFYIESPAMRMLLKQLGTRDFEGVVAASSVIRPGVAQSGMMDEFIRRKRGEAPRLPSHPLLRELLPETEGVMVYQEDVILVSSKVAGLSVAQADILRRTMTGKLRGSDAMNTIREDFISGCVQTGLAAADALEIWRQLSSFSGYSFCKAHSAAFAVLSWQVAYLKAHHPAEFLAAVLSNGGGFYGARAYLSEAQRLGLLTLPPDINYSEMGYKAERGADTEAPAAIRAGLMVIKQVREQLKQRIVDNREHGGRYACLREFIERVQPTPADLHILILCGALDSLGLTRPELLWLARLHHARMPTPQKSSGQLALLPTDSAALDGIQADDYSERRKGELEEEHCGMLIRGHPLRRFSLPRNGLIRSTELDNHAGRTVRLIGTQIARKRVLVPGKLPEGNLLSLLADHPDLPEMEKSSGEEETNAAMELGILAPLSNNPYDYYAAGGRPMLFMTLEDEYGTFEATIFPDAYQRCAPLVRQVGPFIVTGKVEERFGVCQLNVRELGLADSPQTQAEVLPRR